MNKTWLIIKREFSTRVRKKSFILMTVLGPILSSALFILPAYLASLPEDERTVVILDEPTLLDFDKGKESLKFKYLPPQEFDLELAKEFFLENEDYAFLYIPLSDSGDPDLMGKNIMLFAKGDVSIGVENYIQSRVEKYVQREKLKAEGVDPGIIARTKGKIKIRTLNINEGNETESMAPIKMGIGYACGFMIYLFVFLYGAQVMRGVIEEKTSRIVEIMISSVKPIQLMAGKIFGLAAVALTQVIIWIGFGGLFYFIAMQFFMGDKLDAAQIAASKGIETNDAAFEVFNIIGSINFPYILTCFVFFFLFGYLLYAAMFAAIGSAVDKESDTQQFMLPVSLPLIAAIVVLIRALDQPDGSLAFWFSMIPFTSPIVMMARVPFNVPLWELLLSMSILVITFLVITGMAARIYRTGILMYGKKPKLVELLKWLKHK